MSTPPPISPEDMTARIAALRKDVMEAEQRLDRLRAELDWYESGQRLFGGVVSDPALKPALPGLELATADVDDAQSNGAKPTLREAIRSVLAQEPRKTWKTEEVIRELGERDWLPTGEHAEHHTRSMLAEMARKGQAKRIERGRYRLPPPPKGGQ